MSDIIGQGRGIFSSSGHNKEICRAAYPVGVISSNKPPEHIDRLVGTVYTIKKWNCMELIRLRSIPIKFGNHTNRRRVIIWLVLLIFAVTYTATPVLAVETTQPQLALEQAIDAALKHSAEVAKAGNAVQKAKETLDAAADDVSYIPASSSADANVQAAFNNWTSASISYQSSQKSLTTSRDSVRIDISNQYWSLLKMQEKLKATELAASYAQLQLRIATLKKQVGLLSDFDLLTYQTSAQSAVSSLGSMKNDLDKAYMAFNQDLGLNQETRPVLVDSIPYEKLDSDNLEHEVQRVLSQAPSVWQADQAINLQKIAENLALSSGSYTTYKVRKINVEDSKLTAASTREAIADSTRSLYYSLKSLEESIALADQNLRVQEEALRVIKVKYDIGMATKAEVDAEEKDLASLKASLLELQASHAYTMLTFEKPWAA